MTPTTQVNARKERLDAGATRALLSSVSDVVAVKGRKTLRFSLDPNATPSDDLLAAVMGPSGNLRAPALRVGTTLVVGFRPDLYEEILGP